jgi:hypothetical protein
MCPCTAFTVWPEAGLFAHGGDEDMPLEFRGSASIDPPKRGMRLSGYPISSQHPAMVICEVSTEALRLLGEMPDANSEQLMGVSYAADVWP